MKYDDINMKNHHIFITLEKVTDISYVGEIVVCDLEGNVIACDSCYSKKENGKLGQLFALTGIEYILYQPELMSCENSQMNK